MAALGAGAVGVHHVVMVPLPLQGHINPMMSLAQYLCESGIVITLVHTTHSHTLLCSAQYPHPDLDPELPPRKQEDVVRVEVIPDGLPSADSRILSWSTPQMRDASLRLMRSGVEELLHKLMQQQPPPCCVILDSLLPWGHEVALKFGLPRIALWTSSASMFSLGFHVPHIIAKGFIPATEPGSLENVVDFIPGVRPFQIVEMLGTEVAQEGLQNPIFRFFVSSFEHSKDADRILANTIYDLESSIIDALRSEAGIRIHPVGPLSTMLSSSSSAQAASLLRQESSCLSWLDKQQPSCVLYISFGSMAFLEDNVLSELAYGLEASGERFLWVIRPDTFADKASIEEVLPEGFMERTHDRGMVILWAPQLAVLGHSSVGAFLTHCGWNSVMESLNEGVPMLCFPQQADQMANCKCIVHDWKVGLPLNRLDNAGGQQVVERSHVQRAVSGIMTGKDGTQARRCARVWRDITQNAPSKSNLEKLVDDIKHRHLISGDQTQN